MSKNEALFGPISVPTAPMPDLAVRTVLRVRHPLTLRWTNGPGLHLPPA